MRYSDDDYRKCKEADVREFVPNLRGRGTNRYTDCPFCNAAKGLKYDKMHNGMHCFHCDKHISGPIGAVMVFENVNESGALKIIAERLHILSLEEKRARSIESHRQKIKKSFCEKQLEESGLTLDDVMAKTDVNGQEVSVPTFRRGGKDSAGNINDVDDEMLIYYYDLNGKMLMYSKRGTTAKLRPYVRIRWSNPAAHTDSKGKPKKYEQPVGAPTRLYIPQRIRTAYQNEEQIPTLVVQEGEKKAEKACKHGILSVGIQGIYNIGNEETGLIQDLQYIVQRCGVKNVILLFDSDWDHLSSSLEAGCRVDTRPNSFFGAARKFKNYVQTLHGAGVSVDIYIAHINENANNDKGIDDLLTNTLKGKEGDLLNDLNEALIKIDGKGQYISVNKITTKTENQIKDLWSLNDPAAFFERYRAQLLQLPTFRFCYFTYKVEDGKILEATKSSENDFWTVNHREDNGKKLIEFDCYEANEFLSANGFYRIHTSDLPVDQYKFVRIEDGIVSLTGPSEIRDFIFQYILQASKDRDVRNHFASRLGTLMGPDKLERMRKIEDNFDHYEPLLQKMYFVNGQIEITADDIKYNDRILGQVWDDNVKRRPFKRVPIIEKIEKRADGTYRVYTTEEGRKCEFMEFIENTSNFWHKENDNWTEADENDFFLHIVNKITTIGFLLVDYKFQTEQKAVVAMDGMIGDVGQSNGRSGKSLVGKAISYLKEQCYIDGRNTKNDDDYLYTNVTLRTRNIFLDDVKVNFDFDKFFGALTGDLVVNPKGLQRFIIRNEKSPKFYITTNHAINTVSSSAKDRISYMAFSDWYNDSHSPVDDFHHAFFSDWDEAQWNLFYNFMAECVMYYFMSMERGWYREGRGAVPPPLENINKRTYKQLMGEAFYQWAEIYFDNTAGHLNDRIERKVMYDAYHAAFPDSKFGVSPSNFRTKLQYYCQFKGFHLNPSKPNKQGMDYRSWVDTNPEESFIGESDKSGGKEYFSVFSPEFTEKQAF